MDKMQEAAGAVEAAFAHSDAHLETQLAAARASALIFEATLRQATAGMTGEQAVRLNVHMAAVSRHIGAAVSALGAARSEKDGLLHSRTGSDTPVALVVSDGVLPVEPALEQDDKKSALEMVPVDRVRLELLPPGLPVEIDGAAKGMREEYNPIEAAYRVARQETVDRVVNEPLVLRKAPVRDGSGLYEVITWRAEGDTTDGEFNFATCVRLLVTPVSGALQPPKSLFVPDLVFFAGVPHDPEAVVNKRGRHGFYVHGMDYRIAELEDITDKGYFAASSQTRISHNGRHYAVNPEAGEPVAFPGLTDYDTLVARAYAHHAATIAATMPEGGDMFDRAAAMARLDRAGTPKPHDDLAAYNERLSALPPGMGGRIAKLADALYRFRPEEGTLNPELAAVLMEPRTADAAGLALLNQWSYRTHIGQGAYTPWLTEQLKLVQRFGDAYRQALYERIEKGISGFRAQLRAQLSIAAAQAGQAQAFAEHLAGIQTIRIVGRGDWEVRPK